MRPYIFLLTMSFQAFAMTDAAPGAGIAQPGVDTWLEQIAYWSVEDAAFNVFSVGCGWDGNNFWVSNGACMAGAPTGMFYIFNHDGDCIDKFPQVEAPGWGLRDLCCDGTYMYGSVDSDIDYYSIAAHEKMGAFTGPLSPNRALAYDGTHFYTGSFSAPCSSSIFQLVWDGVSGSTASSVLWSTEATFVYGAAWDNGNNCLWVTSADGSGTICQIAADGSLIYQHTLVPGAVWGGATMAQMYPVRELFLLHQSSPDALRGYDVTGSALNRETWGSIKTLF